MDQFLLFFTNSYQFYQAISYHPSRMFFEIIKLNTLQHTRWILGDFLFDYLSVIPYQRFSSAMEIMIDHARNSHDDNTIQSYSNISRLLELQLDQCSAFISNFVHALRKKSEEIFIPPGFIAAFYSVNFQCSNQSKINYLLVNHCKHAGSNFYKRFTEIQHRRLVAIDHLSFDYHLIFISLYNCRTLRKALYCGEVSFQCPCTLR